MANVFILIEALLDFLKQNGVLMVTDLLYVNLINRCANYVCLSPVTSMFVCNVKIPMMLDHSSS